MQEQPSLLTGQPNPSTSGQKRHCPLLEAWLDLASRRRALPPAVSPSLHFSQAFPRLLGDGLHSLVAPERDYRSGWEYFEAGRYASRFAGLLHDGHSLHLHGRAVSYVGEMLTARKNEVHRHTGWIFHALVHSFIL